MYMTKDFLRLIKQNYIFARRIDVSFQFIQFTHFYQISAVFQNLIKFMSCLDEFWQFKKKPSI